MDQSIQAGKSNENIAKSLLRQAVTRRTLTLYFSSALLREILDMVDPVCLTLSVCRLILSFHKETQKGEKIGIPDTRIWVLVRHSDGTGSVPATNLCPVSVVRDRGYLSTCMISACRRWRLHSWWVEFFSDFRGCGALEFVSMSLFFLSFCRLSL